MKKVINLLLITIILLSITAVTGAQASGTPFSVSGQVVDRFGNPLSGAQVTLIDYNYKVIGVRTTNDNGNYDFNNVVADTDSCKVRVTYTDPQGIEHHIPDTYILWVMTKGLQFIPSKQTYISDYPQPSYGYVWGAIDTSSGTSGTWISGIVYLVSLDSSVKYYEFADNTNGKESFSFYAPPGQYTLYAQHWENGVVYESPHKSVTVGHNVLETDPGVSPTQIILPLVSPTNSADPPTMPARNSNVVNGTVMTKDDKPWPGATVTLMERSDNGTGFIVMKDISGNPLTEVTDQNGNYQFTGVVPTSDDNKVIQARKDIKVMVDYADVNGTKQPTYTAPTTDIKSLYYPDVIMGYGQENAVRNVAMPTVTLPFAKGGWVTLSSIPSGANIYIDGSELTKPDQTVLVTPCTVYIDAGSHYIKMTKSGYNDVTDTITMEANTQHADYPLELTKALVPQWVTLVAAVIILLIVVILFLVLLATRLKFLLTPFTRFFNGLRKNANDRRASKDIARAHKAEAAEQRRLEQQRRSEEKMSSRRATFRERPDSGYSAATNPRDDVDVVNVDPVRRRHEAPKVFEEGKKVFEGSKKIFDLKHIAENRPKKIRARETIDPENDKSSMVFASDLYKKGNTNVERIPYDSAPKQQPQQSTYTERTEREAPLERQPTTLPERRQASAVPERSERIRVPKTSSQQRDGSSPGEKERILRYIRDHPEGVSFIQMSNDLEIIPNNLTYITKELVINDDIEKVKGLYYYKSHASPAEDSSSSVVVWRLDGDK
jgi:Sec-independent protein translocase protein TatA